MRRGRRRTIRFGLALLASVALTVGQVALAAAAPVTPRTYGNPAYSAEFPAPPTQAENQSQLWFHADAWWALLLEPSGLGVRVFELMPDHTWRPTSAVVNTTAGQLGDALHDGDVTHVVTRDSEGSLFYVRLSFDPATRDYRADPPRLVTTRGSLTPATITKDGAGRLWVAYATSANLVITYSDNGGLLWGRLNVLGRTGPEAPEAAALVRFDNRVGVMWSDQEAGSFRFASHVDGTDPSAWSAESALPGPAPVSNQISLVRVSGQPSDTLIAAVKTARGDPGEPPDSPQIQLLVRAPDGQWSTMPVSTVADGHDHALLQVDAATRTLYLFASAGGDIVTKRASLDDLRFEPGIGDLFVLSSGGRLGFPTGTKDALDTRSGLVVLASDVERLAYRHAELAISSPTPVVDPNDHTPPTPPGALQGHAMPQGTVLLSWVPASDGNRWTPAGDGVPVQSYVVLRNGIEIATVTSTSIEDRPHGDAAVAGDLSVDYQVQAVDASGNRSSPADVVVDVPGTPAEGTPTLVPIGLLILAAAISVGALFYAFRRRRFARVVKVRTGRATKLRPSAASGSPRHAAR